MQRTTATIPSGGRNSMLESREMYAWVYGGLAQMVTSSPTRAKEPATVMALCETKPLRCRILVIY